MTDLLDAALELADLGYLVFPCIPGSKQPLTPNGCNDASTDAGWIEAWWKENPKANIGVATRGLLVVDIDGAENPWPEDPERKLQLAATPISETPRGGRHHFFRAPEGVSFRNSAGKLAHHVDTRGDGGYVITPPSIVAGTAYKWLIEIEALHELPEPPGWLAKLYEAMVTSKPAQGPPVASNTIGEGVRNDTLARLAGSMRRVGMSEEEIDAGLQKVNLDRCHPPLLEKEVTHIAHSVSRYEPDDVAVVMVEGVPGVNVSGLGATGEPISPMDPTPEPKIQDPGPFPPDLIHIPGFINEVMDFCLRTAPYPNPVLAFCGALSLQAFLAGRKICDQGNIRTNLFVLGLAQASAGKEWPRKVNFRIAMEAGMEAAVGERFASGEGIQDALLATPSMMFQTDEIDTMFQSISKAKDARHENILANLLTLYSASDTIYPLRRRAGQAQEVIDQPNLVIFGTAIPQHYYNALCERFLTNGLTSRILAFEARRGKGQEPKVLDPPARVIYAAKWWANYSPGKGNLQKFHPTPAVVEADPAGAEILKGLRLEMEAEYSRAEDVGDETSSAIWGRVTEMARKLSLIYAASEDYKKPRITEAAARWGARLAVYQAKKMMYAAVQHVARTSFHGECLKILRVMRATRRKQAERSELLRKTGFSKKAMDEALKTLLETGQITGAFREPKGGGRGRQAIIYQLSE